MGGEVLRGMIVDGDILYWTNSILHSPILQNDVEQTSHNGGHAVSGKLCDSHVTINVNVT